MYRFLFSLILVTLVNSAWAADKVHYNQVSFSEYASKEVENDVLVAQMSSQEEGRKPNQLAHKVNQTIDWALAEIKKHPDIQVQTLNYQTHPIYHKGKVTRWKVQQTIRLESQNSELLGEVVGKLQNRLALKSVQYEISEEARRINHDMLTERAIARFRDKAKTISRAMGRKNYRIVSINLNQGRMPVRSNGPMMYRAAEVVADAATLRSGGGDIHVKLDTNMEAGKREVKVTVSGTIELSEN